MPLSWNDLSEIQKHELIRQYETNKHTIDYTQYSAQPESLRRMIRRYRQSITNTPADYITVDAAIDDQTRWKQTLNYLTGKHRHISVMHIADVHVPYQDDNALALAYSLVRHVQPHIIVVGSDFADFALLSSFGTDPDTIESIDELDTLEQHWQPHIHALNAAAPHAAMVYILGNHERRAIKYLADKAASLRRTVMRRYVEIVRSGGRVQWLGEVDRVTINNTIVQHGNRYGIHPAKGLLDDLAYQASTMFGHNHKPTYYEKRGALFTAKSAGSGCLCELQPHYLRGTRLRQNWQHGTCIGDIDLHGHANMFYNQEFVEDDTGALFTRLGFTTVK